MKLPRYQAQRIIRALIMLAASGLFTFIAVESGFGPGGDMTLIYGVIIGVVVLAAVVGTLVSKFIVRRIYGDEPAPAGGRNSSPVGGRDNRPPGGANK